MTTMLYFSHLPSRMKRCSAEARRKKKDVGVRKLEAVALDDSLYTDRYAPLFEIASSFYYLAVVF
jgi:hypothetical protein